MIAACLPVSALFLSSNFILRLLSHLDISASSIRVRVSCHVFKFLPPLFLLSPLASGSGAVPFLPSPT